MHRSSPNPHLNRATANTLYAYFVFPYLVLILGPIEGFTYIHLYSFAYTSFLFSCLRGKNSIFFHYKPYPNVSSKDMNSSHKCIYSFSTLAKQLQIIHEQQMIQFVFFLYLFMYCVYLLSINDKGTILKTNNGGEILSPWNIPLYLNLSKLLTTRLQQQLPLLHTPFQKVSHVICNSKLLHIIIYPAVSNKVIRFLVVYPGLSIF